MYDDGATHTQKKNEMNLYVRAQSAQQSSSGNSSSIQQKRPEGNKTHTCTGTVCGFAFAFAFALLFHISSTILIIIFSILLFYKILQIQL